MIIQWSAPVTVLVRTGTVHLVRGYSEIETDGGFDGAAVAETTLREIERATGTARRKSWGKIRYHYGRLKMGDVDLLLVSAAVLVNKQGYDNTAANPNNPDPDKWVVNGSRTGDEMSHAWLDVTHLDDKGFEKLVAERKEREERSLAGND